jgi:hypothetical protein
MACGRPDGDKPVFGRVKQGRDPKAVPGSPMTDSSSVAKPLRKHLKAAGITRRELHVDVEADVSRPAVGDVTSTRFLGWRRRISRVAA